MATLAGFMAILMWGFLAVLSVYSTAIPPFQLLAMCFAIASSIIIVTRVMRRTAVFARPKLTSRQWLGGIIGLFGFHFCYFMAMRHAPAIEVSLIAYLWPLLLGVYVAPAKMLLRSLLGGAIGFIGTALMIAGEGNVTISTENMLGYSLAFVCALIWSAYSWFLSTNKNDVEDIAWLTAVGAVLAVLSHSVFETTYWSLSYLEWLAVLLLGLGPVGGAFYLWDIGMKNGNKQWLASLSFATPVFSSLALYIFGMTILSLSIIAAIVLILAGALISNSGRRVHKVEIPPGTLKDV